MTHVDSEARRQSLVLEASNCLSEKPYTGSGVWTVRLTALQVLVPSPLAISATVTPQGGGGGPGCLLLEPGYAFTVHLNLLSACNSYAVF